jgi:hypothetical protein
MWLKRLRRIDRSLSSAIEASVVAREHSAHGFPDAPGDDDLFDTSSYALLPSMLGAGSNSNNTSRAPSRGGGAPPLPLVSPNLSSPVGSKQDGGAPVAGTDQQQDAAAVRRPAHQAVVSLTNTRDNETGEVTVTFPVGNVAATSRRAATSSKHYQQQQQQLLGATIPLACVTSCVVCRASPREVSILEEEVARLRAFVTVQRESFQMQLDDIREVHSAETRRTLEAAQAELSERLVAYMREVEELKKHLSMADGVVVQFARLKEQHADLSRRYEALLAVTTTTGQHAGAVAAAASTPQTPAADNRRKSAGSSAAAGGVADWELERTELLAELEHWKRQAVVAGVAAKTAVGVRLAAAAADDGAASHRSSNASQSPPIADPGALPQPTRASKQQQQQQPRQTDAPAYTSSSLPDAMARLEAWRREVNPGYAAAARPQQVAGATRSSVSASQPRPVDVSPSTVGVKTPEKSARLRQQQQLAEPPSGGGSSADGSLHTGASSTGDGTQSERLRWMKLMENIVGGAK